MISREKDSSLLTRYEKMLLNNESIYFDADEIDEIAMLYEDLDRFREALEVVERGLSLHPTNTDLSFRKVKCFLHLDRLDEAEQLVEALPMDMPESLLLRAEIHFIKAESDAALGLLTQLEEKDDFSLELCFEAIDLFVDFGYLDELDAFIRKADIVLPQSPEILRELAFIYEDRQQFPKAIEIYNNLLDRDPYSFADWLNLSKTYTLVRDFEKAIEAIDFALTIEENEPNALSFKGYCYFDSEQYDLAVEQFKEYLQYADDPSMAYELIAECYVKMGDKEVAHEFLKTAYEKDQTNPNLCYQLAVNYAELNDAVNAVKLLEETLLLDPTDADALAFMAELKVKSADFEVALGYIQESLNSDPVNPESQALAGDIYALLEQSQNSITHYEKALEYNPFDVKTTLKLILAHYTIGNQDKATELLQALDESTLNIAELENISDANRQELEQTKNMLDQLRDILRDNLDENI